MVEEKILKYIKEQPKRPYVIGEYHPSSVFKCQRCLYFSFFDPPEIPDDSLLVMELGNILHEAVQARYPKEQTEVRHEITRPNFTIKMSLDIETHTQVIELKSAKRIPREPYEEHIWQVQIYMGASGKDEAVIVYMDKLTFRMTEYVVKFNEALFESILVRFGKLHQHLIKKEPPVRENKLFHNHPKCNE